MSHGRRQFDTGHFASIRELEERLKLGQTLGPVAPDGLVDRLEKRTAETLNRHRQVAQSSAELERLLDRALAAEAPAGLADRMEAATRRELAARRTADRGAVARIGSAQHLRWAAAAAIVLLVGGVSFWASRTDAPPADNIAVRTGPMDVHTGAEGGRLHGLPAAPDETDIEQVVREINRSLSRHQGLASVDPQLLAMSLELEEMERTIDDGSADAELIDNTDAILDELYYMDSQIMSF